MFDRVSIGMKFKKQHRGERWQCYWSEKNWEMRNLEKIRSNQMTVQFYMAVTSSFPACFFSPPNSYITVAAPLEKRFGQDGTRSHGSSQTHSRHFRPARYAVPRVDLTVPNSARSVGEQWGRRVVCKRCLQLQKSDGWCQEGTVKHMQPLALLGHPVPCMSVARYALHNIWIHCTLCVQVPRNSSFMSSE